VKKLLLSLIVAVGLIGSASAAFILSTAQNEFVSGTYNQGWYSDEFTNVNSNDNYSVGRSYPFGTSQPVNYRNYFTFFIPYFSDQISEATLTLQRFLSEGSITYTLFQVSKDASELNLGKSTFNIATYNDLGDGISYGSFPNFYNGNSNDLLSFSLNAAGLSAITDSQGKYFSIGGSITDGLVAGQYQNLFSGSFGYAATLTIVTIPEPSAYALFGIGVIGMLMVLRRKKTI
jgi:hypothetical protein